MFGVVVGGVVVIACGVYSGVCMVTVFFVSVVGVIVVVDMAVVIMMTVTGVSGCADIATANVIAGGVVDAVVDCVCVYGICVVGAGVCVVVVGCVYYC